MGTYRASQSGERLALARLWADEPWAALLGLKIERRDITPTTYFLLDVEQARTMMAHESSDELSNPFARPKRADGTTDMERLHVGVIRIGGKGDDLMSGATLIALKRRFPNAHITLFARDNTNQLAEHPGVDRLVFGGNILWDMIARDARGRFDVFIDLKYVPKLWVFKPDDELRTWHREWEERFRPLEWYYWNFPSSNNKLIELGLPLIELANNVLNVQGSEADVQITVGRHDRAIANILKQFYGGNYAVIHNGSACGRQTKNWLTESWVVITQSLLNRSLPVVQIGTLNEEHVPGTLDLRGLTTVSEMAGVIEGADILLDTEGGPVHIARAVRTPAVVLFGPTPAALFGYKEYQTHVETTLPCRGCWYRTHDWHLRCPEGMQGTSDGRRCAYPLCMETILPENVLAAIRALEIGKRGNNIPAPITTPYDAPSGEKQIDTQGDGTGAGQKPYLADVVIAIPTRNRVDSLRKLLESIERQTVRCRILLVNDSDAGRFNIRLAIPDGMLNDCTMIVGQRSGPHYAHQLALEHLKDTCEYILRLDDDIVLETDTFVERLHTRILDKEDGLIGAVGGTYPQPEHPGVQSTNMIGGDHCSTTLLGMMNGQEHCQFYRYDREGIIEVEHLYSSFIYNVKAALAIGGFPLCYSPRGHREETDFTYRLYRAGWKLKVDIQAIARHERAASGGLRDIADVGKFDQYRREDERLFIRRFNEGKLEKGAEQ